MNATPNRKGIVNVGEKITRQHGRALYQHQRWPSRTEVGSRLQCVPSVTDPAAPRGGSDHHRDETAAVTQYAALERMAVVDSHLSEPVRARGSSAADDSHRVQAQVDSHRVPVRVDTPEQLPAAYTRGPQPDVVAVGPPPSDHHHTPERADTRGPERPAAVGPPPFLLRTQERADTPAAVGPPLFLLHTRERADTPAAVEPPPFLLRTRERADTPAVPFHRDTPVPRSLPAPSALGSTYLP